MNCQEYWNTMPEFAARGDVSQPDRSQPDRSQPERSQRDRSQLDRSQLNRLQAAAHLAECPACQARSRSQRDLAAGLRTVAAGFRKVEAPPRVESRLLAAFRAQSGVAPLRGRRRWIPVLTWAAAFAAMLALGIFLVRERQPEAARVPVARGVERAMLDRPTDFASDFEGFIPLPDAGALPADEDMDVVHVEVPRSAMLAAGLEVSADRAGEMVQADVLLGSDGVARAVRFLD